MSIPTRILLTMITAVATLCATGAPMRPGATAEPPASGADSLRVSLITCYPGPEVYALCGHEAIRIRTATTDSVWNYGIFDFNEPNFIYRFVKGQTDYRLAGYPFAWFMPEYIERGSKVVEQDLNLTPEQALRLRSMLRHEALPENSKYRYNYLKDNCATRIAERLDSALGAPVRYAPISEGQTWRDAMRHYHANYPWYQFGIDLALGGGLDQNMKGRDDMFVPMVMMARAADARQADGKPLVSAERVLNEGRQDAVLPPTPFLLTPLFWSLVIFGLSLCVAGYFLWKRKVWRLVYALWFGLIGLAGCLVGFLVFVSEHEATSPNLLLLWLNPLQLVFPLFVWSRRTRFMPIAMSFVNTLVLLCLLIVWPLQTQSANPAFFPLMGATLVLSAAYAIISLNPSYKNSTSGAPAKRSKARSGKGQARSRKK